MPIKIPVTGIISKKELEIILKANAIELREKLREHENAELKKFATLDQE